MSRYDVLAKRTSPVSENPKVEKPANSRRGNPAYRQFSAYIPVNLYRQLKVHLAESDMDLSEAVEQAVTTWLDTTKRPH